MVFISVLVEGIEFGLVTIINGQPTTDPATYYAVRNRGWFLILKLLYNGLAAFGGGYIAGAIAGYAERRHGIALAIVQTVAFLWALTQPEMRRWTPAWLWLMLIVVSIVAILFGSQRRERRTRLRAA
jgi:hypothetical protein